MNKGVLFLMVGNSGSGKDSVIKYVVNKIPGLRKVKRHVTRQDSETEEFISLKKEDFNKDDYFIFWEAYDKLYGVDREVLEGLMNGKNYIVNISRKTIKKTMERWSNCYVIECVIPVKLIRQRLNDRGREDEAEIEKRIQRALTAPLLNPDCTIDTSNSDVSIAGERLISFINSIINQ
ncbi:MAG: hypothetical protein JW791_03275 [Nanoarchaeota archaeon]|nr:hypothetical protein [Nanoarchaeota archaeon]